VRLEDWTLALDSDVARRHEVAGYYFREAPPDALNEVSALGRNPAHTELCNGLRNAQGGQNGEQDGMSFDRNHLYAAKDIVEERCG